MTLRGDGWLVSTKLGYNSWIEETRENGRQRLGKDQPSNL